VKVPLQITFRNMKPSTEVENLIRAAAVKLETFYRQIMGCRVAVDVPHRHHRRGPRHHVRIDLTMPGGEIVINREPSLGARARHLRELEITKKGELRDAQKDLRFAIESAFRIAGRRLQDYARRQGGQVKTHVTQCSARVQRLFPSKSYGFLITPDGREIYFHKASVLRRGFLRLKIGTRVCFAEEAGEKGAQASTVRIMGKSAIGKVLERAEGTSDDLQGPSRSWAQAGG
jgi:cold shock CspA family protein